MPSAAAIGPLQTFKAGFFKALAHPGRIRLRNTPMTLRRIQYPGYGAGDAANNLTFSLVSAPRNLAILPTSSLGRSSRSS